MKIFRIRWISSLIILAAMFSGFSCAHRNAGEQDMAIKPAEHERPATPKGLQEAKKIVVARVNGTAITLSDLINKMNQLAASYLPDSHQRTPELDQAVKQEALDILIFRELAVQEARRQGMAVPSETLDNYIRNLKKSIGSEDAFSDYLIQTDSTEESLKKTFERNKLFELIAIKEIDLQADKDNAQSTVNRKNEWESELKKSATIEILLGDVEKKMKEESEKARGK